MADSREDQIIRARILEPCLEVLESMARKQKGKGGVSDSLQRKR